MYLGNQTNASRISSGQQCINTYLVLYRKVSNKITGLSIDFVFRWCKQKVRIFSIVLLWSIINSHVEWNFNDMCEQNKQTW